MFSYAAHNTSLSCSQISHSVSFAWTERFVNICRPFMSRHLSLQFGHSWPIHHHPMTITDHTDDDDEGMMTYKLLTIHSSNVSLLQLEFLVNITSVLDMQTEDCYRSPQSQTLL